MVGGWHGVITAPWSARKDYPGPYTLAASGNRIQLVTPSPYPYDGPPTAFNLVSAENVTLSGNTILSAGRAIQTGLKDGAASRVAPVNLSVRCNDFGNVADRALFVRNPDTFWNLLFEIHATFVANRLGRSSTRHHLHIEGPDPLAGIISIRGANLYSNNGTAVTLESPQTLFKSWGSSEVVDDTAGFNNPATSSLY